MLVGAMNNPSLPLEAEIDRIAAAGFDFVDLTLEPPGAWPADGERVRDLLRAAGVAAIGHSAYYLPIASPLAELRKSAHTLFGEMLDTFVAARIELVNVHPDPINRLFTPEEIRARNAEALAQLTEDASTRGIRLMVENLGRSFSRVEDLQPLFDAAPALGFHLDVGHANMLLAHGEQNRTPALLAAFGDRLAHVHAHDNLGVDDLHLPLGSGTVDWPLVVGSLKQAGWDGSATLEVFTARRDYLDLSRKLWLEWWTGGNG